MTDQLETVQEIALAVIVLCTLFYYGLLRKKERKKASLFASMMSFVAPAALFVLGVSFLNG